MRSRKSHKYKNYGPIPQNEYRPAGLAKSIDAPVVLEVDPQAGGTAYRQRLLKRQAQHPAGRRKIRGWSRTWMANGWRAESAALHDEASERGKNSNYV